jgi:pimeloyl-ACP methyl ester carboxylesterase
MNTKRLVLLLLALLLLNAACQTPEPTPTPIPPDEESEPTNTAAPPTNTPAPPTATAEPTDTPIPPTNTPVPPTATPIPTEPPVSSNWEEADCAFDIPAGQDVDCGYLTVLEDRSQPDGPTLRLHVGIFRTESDNPQPDPIVYLEGGPGGNALEPTALIFNQRFAQFLENRDFIMVDQRGTGLSEPALDCPEYVEMGYDLLDDDMTAEAYLAAALEVIEECRVRLEEEGVNLAAYTSAANAADLEELRLALGYDQWNVYGISYGTRLAQTLMRDYPEGIRSVVLDSVYPLQLDLYATLPTNAWDAYQVLFAGCAADEACNAAYPDLETVLLETAAELNANPVMIEITNPLTGESFDTLLNGDGLLGFLFTSLYSAEIIPLLPKIIYDASEGNFDTLAQIQGSFLLNTEFVSLGMQFAVQCAEEIPFSDLDTVAAAAAEVPELEAFITSAPNLGTGLFTICEAWNPDADPAAIENEPVTSDIPTLVMAGEYDPITPPAWSELVTADLSNSTYVEFPGLGHGASISGECPAAIMLAFIEDPTSEPDTTCIAEMAAPPFVPVIPEVVLVPFESDQFGISGLVPEGWQEVIAGGYARGTSALDAAILLEQAAPLPLASMLELIAGQLGLDAAPLEAGTREANGLTWTIYETISVQNITADLALAEANGTTYVILLQSSPDEQESLYESVFLPVIDALTPQ